VTIYLNKCICTGNTKLYNSVLFMMLIRVKNSFGHFSQHGTKLYSTMLSDVKFTLARQPIILLFRRPQCCRFSRITVSSLPFTPLEVSVYCCYYV